MSELLWIAAPGGGVSDGAAPQALLRALIVPRLTGGEAGSLADFGMENWPQTLAGATFEVRLRNTAGAIRTPAGVVRRDQASLDVWHAFFGGVEVRPFSAPPRYEDPAVTPTSEQATLLIDTYRESARALTTAPPGDPQHRLIQRQLAVWRDRDETIGPPPAPRVRARALREAGEHDFHTTVAMLREHPAVLKALGLILEFTVPVSELEPAGFVQVLWPAAPVGPTIVSPWTAYEFDGRRFLPAAQTSSLIERGMLDLRNTPAAGSAAGRDAPWLIANVDVDGGVKKLREAANAPPAPGGQPLEVLPTLRSAGLMLVRRDRESDFAARNQAATENSRRNSVAEVTLTADDLVLGYRVDIGTVDGSWFSLCRRRAKYEVAGVPVGTPGAPEEGHVKPNAVVIDDNDELRADEVVTRWDGWSLVVPRPTFDGREPQRAPLGEPGFTFEFDVEEGTLPPLRFGETYQLRARVVDVAGGGLDLRDPLAPTAASGLVAYTRYEPVPPPQFAVPAGMVAEPPLLGPGDQADRLVVRSDPAGTTQVTAAPPRYPANASRELRPPATTLTLAEQHGRLDGADERTFELVRRAMALADQGAPASPEDQPLPALPDPAAAGVTAHLRPALDVEDTPVTVRTGWSAPWPNLDEKDLKLLTRSGGEPLIDVSGGDVVVHLAPAEQVTLELSSNIRSEDRGRFTIREWLGEDPGGLGTGGRHPMVTPPHVFELVHAVRRPLSIPSGTLTPEPRTVGQTFAELRPDLAVDTASTVQLDITASWAEWDDRALDRGAVPAPEQITAVPLRSFTLGRGELGLPRIQQEFGDTGHRRVTYSLTGVSRFRQYFHDDEPAEAFLAKGDLAPVHIPSSARPPAPVVLSTVPAFEWGEPEEQDGTILVRRTGGWLRVELARPWFETGDGEQLAVIVASDSTPTPDLQEFLTQAGRDPVAETSAPERWPTRDLFPAAVGPRREVLLPEAGARVVVAPHNVWADEGRLYADIAVSHVPNVSYSPFVQLAVARYQQHSLPGLELSPVVKTAMVGVAPDRTLEVVRQGQDVSVRISGVAATGAFSDHFGTIEGGCMVDVQLERCEPETAAATADLTALAPPPGGVPAWVRVPGQSVTKPFNEELPPLRLPPGSGPLRLYVRERLVLRRTTNAPAKELENHVVFVHHVRVR